MRVRVSVLAILLLVAFPLGARAQSILDLLQSIRQGGGWVAIPIEGGRGSWSSPVIPTMELTLAGCMQVYAGHSGRWDIVARDSIGDGRIEADVIGGEHVPFRYEAGERAQLTVEARWSEPRDTTLLLWVGLQIPGRKQDVCEPAYGGVPPPDRRRLMGPVPSRSPAASRLGWGSQGGRNTPSRHQLAAIYL